MIIKSASWGSSNGLVYPPYIIAENVSNFEFIDRVDKKKRQKKNKNRISTNIHASTAQVENLIQTISFHRDCFVKYNLILTAVKLISTDSDAPHSNTLDYVYGFRKNHNESLFIRSFVRTHFIAILKIKFFFSKARRTRKGTFVRTVHQTWIPRRYRLRTL